MFAFGSDRLFAHVLMICVVVGACGDPTDSTESLILPSQPPADAPRNEIVFASRREVGPQSGRELWAVRADRSGERQITDNAVINDLTAFRLAPDSAGIIFEGYTSVDFLAVDVWTVNTDGSGLTNVTRAAQQWPGVEGRPQFSDPSWAPDGSAIAVVYVDDGRYSIRLLAPDGATIESIGDNNGAFRDWQPRWSPSSSAVAFLSNRLESASADDWRLFVSEITIHDTRLFSDNLAWIRGATWSPDGASILYEGRSSTGERSLYVTKLGDPTPTQVVPGRTDEFLDAGFPVWHPDGEAMAFVAVPDAASREIFVANADGSGRRRVTFLGARGTGEPAFSPDGAHIAFVSDVEGFAGVYVVRLTDLRVWRVTDRGSDLAPRWLPVR